MLPRVRVLVSAMVIFVPLAVTVLKSFVLLPRVILPVAIRLAVPVTIAAPVCVSVPVELTVRLVVLIAGKARFTPVMLRLSSDVVEPTAPPRLTPPAPALMVR